MITYNTKSGVFAFVIGLAVCCLSTSVQSANTDSAPSRDGENSRIQTLGKQVDNLKVRLQTAQQSMERMQTQMASLQSPPDNGNTGTYSDVTAIKDLIARLKQELADLVARNSDLPPTTSLADLERRQQEVEAEYYKLDQQVAAILIESWHKPKNPEPTGMSITINTDKTAFPIILTKGRMVPGIAPYYSFEENILCTNTTTGESTLCTQAKRVGDGTAVALAIKDGDLLDQLIAERGLSTDSYVFMLLVCADSITSFHLLRQAITKRGFSFGWKPFRDRTVLMGGNDQSSGGVVTIFQ